VNSFIRCNESVKPQVMGYYELGTQSSKTFVNGWACDQTINESLDLHVYVGQDMIGATRANLTSENQVLSACGNYKGNYRFNFELSADQIKKYAGQKVNVYGISKSGGPNLLLTQAGSVMIPENVSANPTPAPAQPVCKSSGTFGSGSSLTAWACDCTGDMSTWKDVGGGCYHKPSSGTVAPASCSFNGQSIAHGSPVTAFLAATVPSGSSCTSQVRTCNNGTLSGSYTYSSCTVSAPPASTCNTGTFESSPGSFTEFTCGCAPQGTGWNNVGGGCYHRPYQEKFFCTGSKTKTYFRCGMGKPAGSGWTDVGSGCYHKGTQETCQ